MSRHFTGSKEQGMSWYSWASVGGNEKSRSGRRLPPWEWTTPWWSLWLPRQEAMEKLHGAGDWAVATCSMMMTTSCGRQSRRHSPTMPSKPTTIPMGGATTHTGICLKLLRHSCQIQDEKMELALRGLWCLTKGTFQWSAVLWQKASQTKEHAPRRFASRVWSWCLDKRYQGRGRQELWQKVSAHSLTWGLLSVKCNTSVWDIFLLCKAPPTKNIYIYIFKTTQCGHESKPLHSSLHPLTKRIAGTPHSVPLTKGNWGGNCFFVFGFLLTKEIAKEVKASHK